MPTFSGGSFNGGTITAPLVVRIPGQASNPIVALANDTFDTDPLDPVLAFGVNDDGSVDVILSGTTGASDVLGLENRGGSRVCIVPSGLIVRASALPDATLNASDLQIYLDPTNGASKLMVKAKSANGTVVTGQVALA